MRIHPEDTGNTDPAIATFWDNILLELGFHIITLLSILVLLSLTLRWVIMFSRMNNIDWFIISHFLDTEGSASGRKEYSELET